MTEDELREIEKREAYEGIGLEGYYHRKIMLVDLFAAERDALCAEIRRCWDKMAEQDDYIGCLEDDVRGLQDERDQT